MDSDIIELINMMGKIKNAETILTDYYNINSTNDKIISDAKGNNVIAYICADFGYYILKTLDTVGVVEDKVHIYEDIDNEDYLFTFNGIPYYIDEEVAFGDIKFKITHSKEE